MTLAAYDAAKIIKHRRPDFAPRVALVLGSGMGPIVEAIQNPVIIPYQELPDFHIPNIAGHSGQLYLGTIDDVPVICMQGRAHYYEDANNHTIKTMIRTLKLLGCDYYLATNASGAVCKSWKPGDLILIKDHINLQFNNPLVGPNEDDFGPRFPSMYNAYDSQLRQLFHNVGKTLNISLNEGVYVGVLGPSFETPAEIHAYRTLGADLVGMSTVSEVIVARHCDMRVAVISMITNMAAGVAQHDLTHEETLHAVQTHLTPLKQLICKAIKELIKN